MRMLIATLEELIQAHEMMLDIAQKKQEVLVKGDVQQLSALLQEEGTWLKQVSKLEHERQFQVEDCLRRLGLKAEEDITLSRLLPLIPDKEERNQVEALATQLLEIIGRLQRQNELNMRLTQDALKAVNHSLEVLTQSEPELTYQKPEQNGKNHSSEPSRRSFFDTKA
ncbi:FlgN family protein [Caldalkalibacillus thermarum TA2.A1]|uniref:Flagellar protein FlgN n=1 Tax=Caldalkalibacillus thermarum (strain TA2.A1) TaxID=986075 RepID=F5L4E8_CALTT|nr:flagellar protein FlgN [Caldalkalibacillus thermarum]EGL83791.1 FlgN family protein [Caldalkalibacillus thermarum TA2.A1]QZT33967.1 flagellar protein FlgN [Caldalkalibacillus thermarum TA2.A1]